MSGDGVRRPVTAKDLTDVDVCLERGHAACDVAQANSVHCACQRVLAGVGAHADRVRIAAAVNARRDRARARDAGSERIEAQRAFVAGYISGTPSGAPGGIGEVALGVAAERAFNRWWNSPSASAARARRDAERSKP